MRDMSTLDDLRELIKFRKSEAYCMLKAFYDDEQIKDLCQRYKSQPPDQMKNELDGNNTFAAVTAIFLLMCLEHKFTKIRNGDLVTAEETAIIAGEAMNAGLCLMEAGWKPAEPLAETQMKMKRNQPRTRKRKNLEKDDFRERMKEYRDEKGTYPVNCNVFFNSLEKKGYIIDRAEDTIELVGEWDKPRSIGTAENWFREMKKAL